MRSFPWFMASAVAKTVVDFGPCCGAGVEWALFASGIGAWKIAQQEAVPAVTVREVFVPISIWSH
jgi:hypothetical protein